MKTLAIAFIILFCASNLFSQIDNTDCIADCEKANYSKFIKYKSSSALNNTNIVYQRCEWNINPEIQYISGKITTYFVPNTTINQIEFDLNQTLVVDSVKRNNVKLTFTQTAENILNINLPSISAETTDSISVYYQGIPPNNGFGSFVQSSHYGAPIIWTLSEPYGAKDWWPCKESLTDKIDSVDIIITSPQSYTAVSNGNLIQESQIGENKIFHWKHRYPIATYLIGVSATNYLIYSKDIIFNSDTVKLVNYVYPEDTVTALGNMFNAGIHMQLYDTLFGVYPFKNEKYGQAQFGWGGGMEHQTITFLGNWGYELQAHELAHHWFGNKITCGSWEDIWINEGFATYMSGLCYEHLWKYWWRIFKIGKINQVTSEPDGSVFCTDTTDVNRIFSSRLSYAKGSMILNQLRWIIGDSAFFKACNNFLNDQSLAYNFAKTPQLINHFEQSSGQDLSWYFNDWHTGEGYPSYQINWQENSSNIITLTLNQSQSNPSVDFFELPLQIRLFNSTNDTLVRINNTVNGQTFTFPINFKADSLEFDPNYWIISKNNTITNEISEFSNEIKFAVFPNPTQETISLSTNKNIQNINYEIFDNLGRLTKNGILKLSDESIDIRNLHNGLYTIRINTRDRMSHFQFVVQK